MLDNFFNRVEMKDTVVSVVLVIDLSIHFFFGILGLIKLNIPRRKCVQPSLWLPVFKLTILAEFLRYKTA